MGKGRIWMALALCGALIASAVWAVRRMNERWLGEVTCRTPAETADELNTPDRGFYFIHGFMIEDGMDCRRALEETFSWDRETRLALVEFNLQHYSGGDISPRGLEHIATLFDLLRTLDKHYIVRFVYDWDGKNMEVEPTDVSIVKRHMEQVGPLVNQNKDQIFTLQGLFVGNWGEMNGTRYVGKTHWRELTKQLAGVTDGDVYLAVRMPFQWRCATGYTGPIAGLAGSAEPAARLGLYNDGMMGSKSDLGTYGNTPRAEGAFDDIWQREDELAFQDELCRLVPNGGEVVYDTPYNDFPQAVENLGVMHVSYLNRDYDTSVLNKWAAYQVSGEGVWDGMDGLTYVERHLGYRFTLRKASMTYRFWRNALRVELDLRNAGFAPAYHPMTAELVFVDTRGEEKYVFPLAGDIRSLAGGADRDRTLRLTGELPLGELERGNYKICFRVRSERYAREIELANTDRYGGHGYLIGGIQAK